MLKSHLPLTANVNNPVDVIGDAAQDRYENALSAVIKDEGVDGALVILTPQSMTNAIGTAEAIVHIARRSHKPILCCFMGIIDVSAGVKYLQEKGVPVYRFPESAAKTFGALYRYSPLAQPPATGAPFPSRTINSARRKSLPRRWTGATPTSAKSVVQNCWRVTGLNVLPTVLATSAAEAGDAADRIGYPVVMKIVSPQIIHKSDAGGVIVGPDSREAVTGAFQTIVDNAKKFSPDATIAGVLVQRLAPKGMK